MKDVIGIVGLGDLGKRLAAQLASHGFEVVAVEHSPISSLELELAVDPNLPVDKHAGSKVELVANIDDVIQKSRIIHWALPSSLLSELSSELPGDRLVILHDSVMHNSEVALQARNDADQFSIVHCLVNDAKRVVVANDDHRAFAHFQDIGLAPQTMTPIDHDRLLAHSQGILASLVNMGVKAELEQAAADGDLTPSGEELYALLKHREIRWTASTMHSILQNPALKELMIKMNR